MTHPRGNRERVETKPMHDEKEKNAEPRLDEVGTSAPLEGDAVAGEPISERPGEAESPAPSPGVYQQVLAEKQELYDRLLRKQAEFENFRKRVHREKDDFLQHANVDLIRSLLPVLDGFERALQHRDASVPDSFYQGMDLIHQELLGVLSRAGVTAIDAAGKTFDPHLHQAVESVEAKGHRDQEVVEELQRGYQLKNRLLRPAIVKVARK